MLMDKNKERYYENLANTIIKNFNKRQIEGYYCPSKKAALEKALELMPKGSSVGWGGSMTLIEMGLIDAIKKGDYKVIDREITANTEELRNIYGEICCADYFLMSTNAITLDGELINIDGRGNRVAFLCFGPRNVLILVGMNKVVTDVETGVKRTREIASSPNAIRLNRKTPCAITGRCQDCYSPDCMCGQLVVTRRSGIPNRIKVILIGEELGY